MPDQVRHDTDSTRSIVRQLVAINMKTAGPKTDPPYKIVVSQVLNILRGLRKCGIVLLAGSRLGGLSAKTDLPYKSIRRYKCGTYGQ